MVNFTPRKLQVFVSSTFKDMQEDREAAVEAILRAGHIPAGMELFAAGDESQWEVIKQWIEESDVFLLLLGGRYGTIERKSRRSYIELEYEYAEAQNIPRFACVINPEELDRRVREHGIGVFEQDEPAKLKKFRDAVSNKMVRFYDDAKDIKLAVMESLSGYARDASLRGWVRPSADVPALANELARLSTENNKLREELSRTTQVRIGGLTVDEYMTRLKQLGAYEFFINNLDTLPRSHDYNEEYEHALIRLEELGLFEFEYRCGGRLTQLGMLVYHKMALTASLSEGAG